MTIFLIIDIPNVKQDTLNFLIVLMKIIK